MRVASSQKKGRQYPPPLILPIEKEDAHPIAVFSVEASSGPIDSYFRPSPAEQAHAIKSTEKTILALLDNPAFMLMKAVDRETEEAASFAIWERVERSGSSQDTQRKIMRQRKWAGGMKLNLQVSTQDEHGEIDPLTGFIIDETSKFMASWASDMNYIELQALATSKRFQRRGYATALVRWGHDKADAESQVCFLLGSPAGRPLYAHLGWKEVGQIVVDMRKWAAGADGDDLGWGTWKLYHMLRLPRAVV